MTRRSTGEDSNGTIGEYCCGTDRSCFCLQFQLDAAATAKAKWRAALRSCVVNIREAVPPIGPEMTQSSYLKHHVTLTSAMPAKARPIQGMREPQLRRLPSPLIWLLEVGHCGDGSVNCISCRSIFPTESRCLL